LLRKYFSIFPRPFGERSKVRGKAIIIFTLTPTLSRWREREK
jgi:hypothetical protein